MLACILIGGYELFARDRTASSSVIVGVTCIAITFFALVALVPQRKQLVGWLNPSSLFTGVWVSLLTVYGLSTTDYPPLQGPVAGLLIVASASLAMGTLSGGLFRAPTISQPLRYNEDRLRRAYGYALLALTGSVVLQFAKVAPLLGSTGGLSGILTGSGLDFRRAYLAERVESLSGGLGGGGLAVAVLGYLLFCGTVAVIWAGHYIARGQILRATLPLLLTALYSVLTLQRAAFIYPFLIFLFSWHYHARRRDPAQPKNSLFAPAAVAALVLLVLVIPAYLRSIGGGQSDAQGGLVQYAVSGIAGLNADYLVNPNDETLGAAATGTGSPYPLLAHYDGPPLTQGYGVWTFTGIVSIIERLGVPIALPPSQFAFLTIGSGVGEVSNTYSFILFFYYDGGWAGVALLSFLLGMAAMVAHLRVGAGDGRWLGISCLLMTTLAMSWFAVTPLRDFRYIVLGLAAFLLYPLIRDASHRTGALDEAVS